MPSPELEVKNLKVEFATKRGRMTAVNGVSYRLDRGETIALVGESGCGKTVSALSILRLIPEPPGNIASGEIRFQDRDILSLSPNELRKLRGNDISMIFQDPMTSLNPTLSLGTQLAEILTRHTVLNHREAIKKSIELLRRVDIPSPEKKMSEFPHQLSGGMRQRVMIAMALSCDPRILIADEPTTALDVIIQAQIMDLLEQLKEETGLSVILITHDLGIVTEIAQRILVMYAGEIVESGSVTDLFRSPLHPYTKGLMNSVPKLSAKSVNKSRLQEIPGNVPSPNNMPSGCPFHPRCPEALERCKTEKPALKALGSERAVSCWLH